MTLLEISRRHSILYRVRNFVINTSHIDQDEYSLLSTFVK